MPSDTRFRLPPRPLLLRLLTDRAPVSLDDAARLLGTTASRVRREAAENRVLLPGARVPWEDVAFELFAAWPRALILETLGEAIHVVPSDLHLTRPGWSLPIYLVRAMEEQARTSPICSAATRPRSVDDYVADLLHQAIDPEAIARLREDATFVAAYEYPHGEKGRPSPFAAG